MENLTFTIFSVAILIGLVHGIYWLPRKISLPRSLSKTIPVALLAIAGFAAGGPLLLIVALALSAGGDAFLSRDGEKMFLAGLGCFLTAHLAFVALFLTHPSPLLPTGEVMITVWVLTAILMLLVLTSLWRHLAAMKIPVFIYTLAIGAMNISAWISGQEALLLAGVALFVFSDMVLAHELFVWQKPAAKKIAALTVWFSYFLAQVLILYSFI